MEHSSYELSVQLRDAGFPQPDIDNGQVWWRIRFPGGTLRHPAPFQYVKTKTGRLDDIPLDGMEWVSGQQVYAPTALDILKELGGQYNLSYMGNQWHCLSERWTVPCQSGETAIGVCGKMWMLVKGIPGAGTQKRVSVVEAANAMQKAIDNLTKS